MEPDVLLLLDGGETRLLVPGTLPTHATQGLSHPWDRGWAPAKRPKLENQAQGLGALGSLCL